MAEKLKDFEYYMNLNYPIKYWNDDDGFFIEIPDLPGCMTFCEKFNQINEVAEDAKKSWISSRIERGLEVPEPRNEEDFSGKILLRLTKSLHRTLSNQAKREGVSLNQYILGLLSGKSSVAEVGSKVIEKIEAIKEPQGVSASSVFEIRTSAEPRRCLTFKSHRYAQSELSKQSGVDVGINDETFKSEIVPQTGRLIN